MTTTQEFIASYWTLAGNVVPLGPPDQEASPQIAAPERPCAKDMRNRFPRLALFQADLKHLERHLIRRLAGLRFGRAFADPVRPVVKSANVACRISHASCAQPVNP